MRDSVIAMFIRRGLLLKPEALEYILSRQDPIKYTTLILKNYQGDKFVLTKSDLVNILAEVDHEHEEHDTGSSMALAASTTALGKGASCSVPGLPTVHVVKNYTECCSVEKFDDFRKYFICKYRQLLTILRRKADMRGAVPIKTMKDGEVRFVGMIYDLRTTKRGNLVASVEDETGCVRVVMSKSLGKNLMEDMVIGIIGNKKRDFVIANEVVWPDPIGRTRKKTKNGKNERIVFISDTHVGSVAFLEHAWRKFVDWLNFNADGKRIKYLVIAGDLVDGLEVYPGQLEDLAITDIYEQYKELARLLSEIDEKIQIVMIPGNHDAVRPMEPQPPIFGAMAEYFDHRTHLLSNPSVVELGGATVLLYHGRSVDDFVAALPGLTYKNPLEAMKIMLRACLLAPTYGRKTPLSPDGAEHMVIQSMPDVFVTGHVHASEAATFRGTLLLNASTWQGQTEYQKMRNIDPRPGVATVVDAGNCSYRQFCFT